VDLALLHTLTFAQQLEKPSALYWTGTFISVFIRTCQRPCATFYNIVFFSQWGFILHPSSRTIPCWLSETAYSVYSQLLFPIWSPPNPFAAWRRIITGTLNMDYFVMIPVVITPVSRITKRMLSCAPLPLPLFYNPIYAFMFVTVAALGTRNRL
jgi:hypothetical protein